MKKSLLPFTIAGLALVCASLADVSRPTLPAADASPSAVPFVSSGVGATGFMRLGDGPGIAIKDGVRCRQGDDSGPCSGETASIFARIIPNPFAIEALQAQPNRASVQVTAPYRVTVGTSAVQLTSSGNVNGGVCIKALVPGQTMYLGVASTVTTATGWPMSDNESLCLEVRNANVLYGIASAAAQAVAVLPFSRF